MGMDLDRITVKAYVQKLEDIFKNIDRDKRGKITDDIIEFVEKMNIKYNKK